MKQLTPLIIPLPGNETMAEKLAQGLGFNLGRATFSTFPDGERYVKLDDRVEGKEVILVATLDRPDDKILSLLFLSATVRAHGALKVGLVAPYLAYMRQDTAFAPGECVSSLPFANFISQSVDWLLTVEPHLHRRSSLAEIYRIPSRAVHSAPDLSAWIVQRVLNPIILGPKECSPWLQLVADAAGAPFLSFHRERKNQGRMVIKLPDLSEYIDHTPVLVDDIISSAGTMLEAVHQLTRLGSHSPVCLAVHGIFAEGAYERLAKSQPLKVVTTNTVAHETNQIDMSDRLIEAIREMRPSYVQDSPQRV